VKKLLTTFLASTALLLALVRFEEPASSHAPLALHHPVVPGRPPGEADPWEPPASVLDAGARPPAASSRAAAGGGGAVSQALRQVPAEDDWGRDAGVGREAVALASVPVLAPVRPAAVAPEPVAPAAPAQAETATSATGSAPATQEVAIRYLPPGARDEAEANLTLIAPEVAVFREPGFAAEPAPFRLREGDVVRPLTRLRSATDFDWIQFEREGALWWAPAELFIRIGTPRTAGGAPGGDFEIGAEPVDRNTALPPDYVPSDLVPVAGEFVLGGKTILLRHEAEAALEEMLRAARQEGLELRVFSGFRDFGAQRRLYLEAIAKQGPKQNGTAAPGYSEHQLGTTVDVTNRDPAMILSGHFGETPEGRWLFAHAAAFGFIHSYTEENTEEAGYKPEPWHLRYVGRLRAPEIVAARALAALTSN
jgi:LAS superfamily LD-carboxypeptidase LdcB